MILKCNYLKPQEHQHLERYVKYIATREGVEKIRIINSTAKPTKNQKHLIKQILLDFPDAKELLEYEDYHRTPNRKNASEFITRAVEICELCAKRENYVDYISHRPGVVSIRGQGLFTETLGKINLAQTAKEIAHHQGNVWTNIISLRREDAMRLGYDQPQAWKELIMAQRNVIAESMKIKPENLKWYAAMHNESHHPHVHMIVYSSDPKEAYLTKQGIEAMRSAFSRQIFKQDRIQIYEAQTTVRDQLKQQTQHSLQEYLQMESTELVTKFKALKEELEHTPGKKDYGYLPKQIKKQVDDILEDLVKQEPLHSLYDDWYSYKEEILSMYRSDLPQRIPISQQKEFTPIKNMIIQTCIEQELPLPKEQDKVLPLPYPEGTDNIETDVYVKWDTAYKQARTYLFGSERQEPDYELAYTALLNEANKGNVFAMADLGRMECEGIGRERNQDAGSAWYYKSLQGMLKIETEKPLPYLEYRIGKAYRYGLGCVVDVAAAIAYFKQSALKKNTNALYSLGTMYLRGEGVEADDIVAAKYLLEAAQENHSFACYEIAKLYRQGKGVIQSVEEAEHYEKIAFVGFEKAVSKQPDDRIQYRLGMMCKNGIGCKVSETKAETYWLESSKVNNKDAQYALGKLYLEQGKIEEAIHWWTKALESEHPLASYQLGKLYYEGQYVNKQEELAVELLRKSAEAKILPAIDYLSKIYLDEEGRFYDPDAAYPLLQYAIDQKDSYAMYRLANLLLQDQPYGKQVERAIDLLKKAIVLESEPAIMKYASLLLKGEVIPKDTQFALSLLTPIANQGNDYAQYLLGHFYFMERDKKLARYWLECSAKQGNDYAQFLLDHLDGHPQILWGIAKIAKAMESTMKYPVTPRPITDSKLARKINEKKLAMGQKLKGG